MNNDYSTVGWICALELEAELAASQTMLDLQTFELQAENDTNTYTLGRIGKHNVVLACLPSGTTGTLSVPQLQWQETYFDAFRESIMVE
jgi:ankyrin repeat domain-containing protein 50